MGNKSTGAGPGYSSELSLYFFAEEGHPMEWCDPLQYVFTCVGDPLGTSEFQWGIQKKSSGAIGMFLYAEPWK